MSNDQPLNDQEWEELKRNHQALKDAVAEHGVDKVAQAMKEALKKK
jgi:uncharacterized protein YdcH (DUF465 family)